MLMIALRRGLWLFRVLALAGVLLPASAQPLRFAHLTQDQGLPINAVRTVYQDRDGFLWVGTHEGLARYDGYGFKTFRFDPKDPHSLSDNVVTRLAETADGGLWIASFNGLNRYDRALEHFARVPHGHAGADRLYALLSDAAGGLWIGCEQGLSRLDPSTGALTHYGPDALPAGEVRDLALDREGGLWVALFGAGLARRDPATGRFVHQAAAPGGLPDNRVSALSVHGDTLVVGTRSAGLAAFGLKTGRWRHDAPDPANPQALADGAITSLYHDRAGTLWVGTFEGGLHRYDAESGHYTRFRHNPADPSSLSHDTVRGIYEDASGVLWIATRQGLDKYDGYHARFTLLAHEPGNPHSLSHDTIGAVLEARDGTLWVGTQPGGLNRIERKTGQARHFRHEPQDANSLPDDLIWSLLEDRQGRLWVGTASGLARYRPESGDFLRYPARAGDAASGPAGQVQALFQDSDGWLWVSADDGLYRLDPETGRFRAYHHDPAHPASLSSDRVGQVAEAEDGSLWIAFDGELNRLDRRTGTITRVRPADPDEIGANTEVGYLADDYRGGYWLATTRGLRRIERKTGAFSTVASVPSVPLFGVLVDARGEVWASGNRGLYRHDPASGKTRVYYAEDGLQGNEYNAGAFHQSRSGELFFGGVAGLSAFFPEQIVDHARPPPVVFTELRLYNRPVAVGSAWLPRALNELPVLHLGYRDDVVSIAFAGLDSANPSQNRYAWRLRGLGEDWIASGAAERTAQFTDLAPGEYVLEVKASNKHGVWNEAGRRLAIQVAPPPWRTAWAYAAYGLALAGLLYAVWRRQQQRLREQSLQAQRLRVAVDERTAELRTRNAAIHGLLDSAGQGFLAFGADLRVGREYSAECRRLLGTAIAGRSLPELLYPEDAEAAAFLGQVLHEIMRATEPAQRGLYASLLPEELQLAGRCLRLELRALEGGRQMAVLTDISATRALERRVEAEHQRLRRVLKAVLDPRLVRQVAQEYRAFASRGWAEIQARAPDPASARIELFRQVHTFKGTFAQLEFAHASAGLAELEQALAEPGIEPARLAEAFPAQVLLVWLAEDERVLDEYLGPDFLARQSRLRLEPERLDALEAELRRLLAPEAAGPVLAALAQLRLVPLRELFAAYPALVADLAEQTGKAVLPLVLDGDDCPVLPARFGEFARTLVHVFRNLVDHGIELPEARLAAGKAMSGELRCQFQDAGERIELAIADDGAGLDTAALRERGLAVGLLTAEAAAARPDAEIWPLVFEDGLSTRTDVSDLSGRGVGLAAVRAAVLRLGGTVRVASIPGRGTSFLFSLPKD